MFAVSIAGTRLSVHVAVLAAAILAVLTGYGPEAAVLAVSLLAHEVAHLLAAAAYEVAIDEWELLPFGGRARMSGLALADPGVEAVVALAGPVQSLLLFALAESALPAADFDPGLVQLFSGMNLSLALFNLAPALPLDGGRVLRALLSARLGRRRATELAATLGRVTGVVLSLCGATLLGFGYFVPGIFLFAWLIWQRSGEEVWQATLVAVGQRLRAARDFRRRGIVPVRAIAAHGDVPLRQVMHLLVAGKFPVVWVAGDDMQLLGTLDAAQLEEAFLRRGPDTPLRGLLPP